MLTPYNRWKFYIKNLVDFHTKIIFLFGQGVVRYFCDAISQVRCFRLTLKIVTDQPEEFAK